MQTLTEQQREFLCDSYIRGILANYERLSVSPSESIRFEALCRLADYFGICADALAQDHPEPIKFDLEEQLLVGQLHPANRDANRQHRGAIEFITETGHVPQQPPPANVSPPPPPRPPPTIPQAWRADWPDGKPPKRKQPKDQPQGDQPKAE